MSEESSNTDLNRSAAKEVSVGDSNEGDIPEEILDIRANALGEFTCTSTPLLSVRKTLKKIIYQKKKKENTELYGDIAKEEQVDAVASLVHSYHTFVLSGTGFDNSNCVEYSGFLRQPGVGVDRKQVSSINLTQCVLDHQTAKKMIAGVYSFVYLIPEVYFEPVFQSRLSLIVVDKAQVMYVWGEGWRGKTRIEGREDGISIGGGGGG
ncbi:hypothetical protein VP01_11g9 [Puccinia sorghi]|uniref:Uncharacterized protein n=1 Tax=Puccinia sorghi TaxID=27349 RepID=A0A0L6VQL6_9BASI|nr:hypothetical protein VP01_11g9 [Puccinia sorghi]